MTTRTLGYPVKPVIAVIGGRLCTKDETRLAEDVGREIAHQGAVLICGGLGGIMESACKGATEEGGLTIGILPSDDRKSANRYVLIRIATGLGHTRNFSVVQSADAAIAIAGEYGTLSEIAIALKCGIPVIGLTTWSVSQRGHRDTNILQASNAKEAVDMALKKINSSRKKN